MRYTKQRTKSDCAIVAIINACKWSGMKISYSSSNKYIKQSLAYSNKGIYPYQFEKFLDNTDNLPFELIDTVAKPSITEVKKNVSTNRSVIFGSDDGKRSHIAFIFKATKTHIYIANWDTTVTKMSINKFKTLLKTWSIIYIIEKLV